MCRSLIRILGSEPQRAAKFVALERVRYRERSTLERTFERLEDEFGHVTFGCADTKR